MNCEKNRLSTFTFWPKDSSIKATELAKNGFFATSNFQEAQCYWCECIISDWNIGGTVEEKHREVAPTCMFLTSEDCGNVPIPPQKTNKMFNEEERLFTFKNWPNTNIKPETKAGFYYLRRGDNVRCAWCLCVLANWKAGDDAFQEHQRLCPECTRVKLGRLVSISDSFNKLSIQKIAKPYIPMYASLGTRIRSYENWPIRHIQHPKFLARAGFFFVGYSDEVQCFHCFVAIARWKKHDDPLAEHLKFSPDCYFVSLLTGPNKTLDTTSSNITTNNNEETNLPTTSRITQISTYKAQEAELDSTSTSNIFDNGKSANEYHHLKRTRACKICLDETVGVLFLPCGHLVTCFQCAPNMKKCPICRSDIKNVVRTQLS